MASGEETLVREVSTTEKHDERELSNDSSKLGDFEKDLLRSTEERAIVEVEARYNVWLVVKNNSLGRIFTKVTGISSVSKNRKEWILGYLDLFVVSMFMMIGIFPVLYCTARNLKREFEKIFPWILKFSILNLTSDFSDRHQPVEPRKDYKLKIRIADSEDLSLPSECEPSADAKAPLPEASESLPEIESSSQQIINPPASQESTEKEKKISETSPCRTAFQSQSPSKDQERLSIPPTEKHEGNEEDSLCTNEDENESKRIPEEESQSQMPDE